ncbi:hypothetical protein Emag_004138 [Eimeria magna]
MLLSSNPAPPEPNITGFTINAATAATAAAATAAKAIAAATAAAIPAATAAAIAAATAVGEAADSCGFEYREGPLGGPQERGGPPALEKASVVGGPPLWAEPFDKTLKASVASGINREKNSRDIRKGGPPVGRLPTEGKMLVLLAALVATATAAAN